MVVKHLNPGGGEKGGGWRREGGMEEALASRLLEPIEQLKRGCFALLARYNESACGRHVYSQEERRRR